MSDLYDDPEFLAWRKRVIKDLVPKLEDSAMTVSLVPEGETDIKFAVELGLSIMFDKPIIAVIKPGTKVPAKLAQVVDEWVEMDYDKPESGQQRLMEAITRVREGLENEA